MVEQAKEVPLSVVKGRCTGTQGQLGQASIPIKIENFFKYSRIYCDNLREDVPPTMPTCKLGGGCIWRKESGQQSLVRSYPTIAGDITIDFGNRLIVASPNLPREHEPVELFVHENLILGALVFAPGEIVSRSRMKNIIGKYTTDNKLDRAISLLRGKFGDSAGVTKPIIGTVYEEGYRLAVPERKMRRAS